MQQNSKKAKTVPILSLCWGVCSCRLLKSRNYCLSYSVLTLIFKMLPFIYCLVDTGKQFLSWNVMFKNFYMTYKLFNFHMMFMTPTFHLNVLSDSYTIIFTLFSFSNKFSSLCLLLSVMQLTFYK